MKQVDEKQKQPSEVFCKKKCSYKFCKFQGKIVVFEPLFNKVVSLQAFSNIGVFL